MTHLQIGDSVRHETFGIGDVTKLSTNRICAEFAGVEKTFEYSDAVKKDFLTLFRKKEDIDSVQLISIVFLNITWMKYYRGASEDDEPVNGGAWIDEYGDGADTYNFFPVEVIDNELIHPEKYMLGYYVTKKTVKDKLRQTRIENIIGMSTMDTEESADGVLAVWCATPKKGPSHVVGWYRNARIFREYQEYSWEEGGEGFLANVICKAKDAVLLPINERKKPQWQVPRVRSKDANFGFGQSNIWYANKPQAERYVKRMIMSISNYRGANMVRI